MWVPATLAYSEESLLCVLQLLLLLVFLLGACAVSYCVEVPMTDQDKCEHGTASAINHREAVNPAPGQTLKRKASQKCLRCQRVYLSLNAVYFLMPNAPMTSYLRSRARV